MKEIDEALRLEWEIDQARRAMDLGPLCTCGHGAMQHGETRCQRCACGLAWCAREFEQKEKDIDHARRHVNHRRPRLASEMRGWTGSEPPPDVLTEDDSFDRWPA